MKFRFLLSAILSIMSFSAYAVKTADCPKKFDLEITEIERDTHLQQARAWFDRALHSAREADDPLVTASVRSGMALLHMEENRSNEALVQARKAHTAVRRWLQFEPGINTQMAVAEIWHILGLILRDLPAQDLPVILGEKTYYATGCFNESIKAYAQIGQGVEVEMAYALLNWAQYEYHNGDPAQASTLWDQARDIYNQLGMINEVNWMDHKQ